MHTLSGFMLCHTHNTLMWMIKAYERVSRIIEIEFDFVWLVHVCVHIYVDMLLN